MPRKSNFDPRKVVNRVADPKYYLLACSGVTHSFGDHLHNGEKAELLGPQASLQVK